MWWTNIYSGRSARVLFCCKKISCWRKFYWGSYFRARQVCLWYSDTEATLLLPLRRWAVTFVLRKHERKKNKNRCAVSTSVLQRKKHLLAPVCWSVANKCVILKITVKFGDSAIKKYQIWKNKETFSCWSSWLFVVNCVSQCFLSYLNIRI